VALALSKCTPAYGVGTHLINITVGGTRRAFLLKVPANVSVAAGLPAVVAIHGYAANPYYYGLLAGIDRFNNDQHYDEKDPTKVGSFEYDQMGFKWLFALPFGTASTSSPLCCSSNITTAECESGKHLDVQNPCSWNAGSCCAEPSQGFSRKVDDVAFIRAVTDYLVGPMCANSDALFATGFSAGAMMANRLGCELSSIFRGISPFAGPIEIGGDFKSCKPVRPVSVVMFCGTADSECNGNVSSKTWGFQPGNTTNTMSMWAKVNGCGPTTVDTYTSATTYCTKWIGCRSGAIVEQCLVVGLHHNFAGHLRPSNAGGAHGVGYQSATDVDGFRYMMNRFSTLLPDSAAKAVGLPTKADRAAALQPFRETVVVV